mgnify:CR=1 FL=1
MSSPQNGPEQNALESSKESEIEAKPVKPEQFKGAEIKPQDVFDKLLAKHTFWKAIRITAWLKRFLNNSKTREKTNYQCGPLETDEIQAQVQWWIKSLQQRHLESDEVKEDVLKLNLKPNDDELLECRGRIEGHYPLYILTKTLLAEKLVMDAHTSSLHGGVGITMTTVRETYWISSTEIPDKAHNQVLLLV